MVALKPDCANCRWCSKKSINYYPCSRCIGAHQNADYNFFCVPEQINMFGVAELVHCRACGRRVHLERAKRGSYRYVRCSCGNSLQAKVTDEEMIARWNNKPPLMTKMWRVGISNGTCKL